LSGQALPPPTGTAALPRWYSRCRRVRPPVPSGPSGAPHTCGVCVLMGGRCWFVVLQALPPPTGTAARPSVPSGALHAGGAGCWRVVRCVVSDVRPGSVAHGHCGNPRRPCWCLHIGGVGDGCAQSADHFGEIEW